MASRHLSVDGARYPIEPKVLPLVYSLSVLRVIEPCWSCEGHVTSAGESKPPEVWFYSGSLTYPKLLHSHIWRLTEAGELSKPWEVVISQYQPEVSAALLIIQPQSGSDLHLGSLQEDLRRLGATLVADLRELAYRQLDQIQS